METHPTIFEEEGYGSHVSGAVMSECDESIECDSIGCYKQAVVFRHSRLQLYKWCHACSTPYVGEFAEHDIGVEITREEFIAFQVMHS